ncbi:MAG: DUF1801 domain-containing protein [Devosiaceae bacterium]
MIESAPEPEDKEMAQNKTQANEASVEAFLATVEPVMRREDGLALDALFRRITGWNPVMWGDNIVGYGRYHYRYESGREGHFMATGFSPRKANLSLYIMPGYQEMAPLLERLGKHKRGKACLYLSKLADADEDVLAEIIRTGLDDLGERYSVMPS